MSNLDAYTEFENAVAGAGVPDAYTKAVQIAGSGGGDSGIVLLASGTITSPTPNFDINLTGPGTYRYFRTNALGLFSDSTGTSESRYRVSSDGGVTFWGDDALPCYHAGSAFNDYGVTGTTRFPQIGGIIDLLIFPGDADMPAAIFYETGLNLDSLSSISVVDGGTGYQAADELFLLTSPGSLAGSIIVDTVDGGGAVLTAHIGTATRAPFGATTNPNPQGVAGGSGSGATFDFTWTHLITFPVNAIRYYMADGSNWTYGTWTLWGIP